MKHKEGNFTGVDDFNIYFQAWLPENSTVAILLVRMALPNTAGDI